MSKTTNVQFALRRLMAQLKEAPGEIVDDATAQRLQSNADRVLPNPDVTPPPDSVGKQMADHMLQLMRPENRPPPSTADLIKRLQGGNLVEPHELNHLLYSSPEAMQAINAYQGAMDRNALTPEIREALAGALQKQQSLGPTVLNPEGMAEGGEVDDQGPFDPIAAARHRVYGSSSPGSPGISGAIKDAVEALQSYLGATRAENAEERDRNIMRQTEDHSDGGAVGYYGGGSAETHEATKNLGKRFGVRVMEQAYGLDENGNPALGGRAWTSTQGGTPIGLLDEITSVPHRLLSLARTVRSLDPIRNRLPDRGGLDIEDRALQSIDPQWSQDASDRLDRLRAAMNRTYDVPEAHSLPEHLTDAAASLITPLPMTKAGEEAGLAKRILEMTVPLRPRTAKAFGTDTAVLGGLGTGIDAIADRLSRLHSQVHSETSGPAVNPENFSRDMGLEPEDQPVHNSHQMVPLVDEHGNIYGSGVDPSTLARGGRVVRFARGGSVRGPEDNTEVVRKIISPPKGKDGLFIQPKEVGPERELVEQHNRDRFASHFKFADPYTGLTRTYDEKGDYNCGRCNQADGEKCLLLKISHINRRAGSCGDWENLCAGDAEMPLHEKSPKVASYGVAVNGKGFGCHRCPFASRAYQPDSRGRELYCGKGDFRTYGTACCAINGAPVLFGNPKDSN